jgi:hypothetical protein
LPDTVDPETGGAIVTSRMVFVEVADDIDGAELLGPRNGADEATKELQAATFLVETLADCDWHDSAGLKKLAGAQGISARTLQRAAQELSVEYDERGFPRSTWWRLPSRATTTPAPMAQLGIPHGYAESGPVAPVAPPRYWGIEDGTTSDVQGLS